MADLNFRDLKQMNIRIERQTGLVRWTHQPEGRFHVTIGTDESMAIEALGRCLPSQPYTDTQLRAAIDLVKFS